MALTEQERQQYQELPDRLEQLSQESNELIEGSYVRGERSQERVDRQ